MKIISLLLFAIFSLQIAFAQEIKIKSSSEYKLKTWPIRVIGEIEGNIYTVAQNGRVFNLQKNDKSANFVKSEEINLHYKKKNSFYLRSIIIDNKVYAFGTYYDSKSKKQLLIYQEYSINTLSPEGDWNILDEIKNSTFLNYYAFKISLSDNKEKILVSAELAVNSSNKTRVSVFNSKFEKLWSKDNILNHRNQKTIDFKGQLISNEGVIYFLSKNYKSKQKDVVNKKIAFTFSLLQIKKDEEIKQFFISTDNGKVVEARIIFDNNNDIICVGAYSNNENPYNHSGTFFYKIDNKQSTNTIKTMNDYSEDFKLSIFDSSEKKKAAKLKKKGKEIELNNFYNIKELKITKNNSVIVVTECYDSVTTTNISAEGRASYTTKFYVYNLIVVNYNTDGTISWTRRVPILHHSQIKEYISYYMAEKNNNLYFFYNDNAVKDKVKFNNKNKTQVIFSRKTLLACIQIRNDGNVRYYPLKKAKGTNYHFIPKHSLQLGDSKDVIMFSKLGKKQYALRISIID